MGSKDFCQTVCEDFGEYFPKGVEECNRSCLLYIVFPFEIFGYWKNIVMFPLMRNNLCFDNGVVKKEKKFKKSG